MVKPIPEQEIAVVAAAVKYLLEKRTEESEAVNLLRRLEQSEPGPNGG